VGERIITANSVVSFSGDSISAPAVSGNVWIAGSDVFYAGAAYDISAGWFPTVNTAYNKADGLDVTIEFITDQGVTGDTTPSTGHGKIRLPRGQVHHPAGWHFVRGAEK
jgi:hypothetical protein